MMNAFFEKLVDIVGAEWASDEPEICAAYSRDIRTYEIYGQSKYPDYVVLPGTTAEVQQIMIAARAHKVPITIRVTGLSTRSASVPVFGGVLMDLKRMNRILEINEELCTATVEPYVTIAQLSCEMQKRKMFIPVPGAPSTVSVISNYTYGLVNKASARIGYQYRSIVGIEMVLADGSVIRTGSAADQFALENSFWTHGPGPDLHLLGFRALGAFGVITKMTVKGHPLDDEFKIFWGAFDDIDPACAAHMEIIRRELCTGSSFYAGHKYSSYSTDTAEAQFRMNRVHPTFQLIHTFQGTKRRVEYEETIVRKIISKHGGRVISDRLPPYQAFVDSHIGMAGSLYSDALGAMRYWGSRGRALDVLATCTMDKIAALWKATAKVMMNDPYYGDPDKGGAEFGLGVITYPAEGGHYTWFEFGPEGHPTDPLVMEANKRVIPKLYQEFAKLGVPYDAVFNVQSTYLDLMKKVKNMIDPDYIMQPGYYVSSGVL